MNTEPTTKDRELIDFLKKQEKDDAYLRLLLRMFKDCKRHLKKLKKFKDDDTLIWEMVGTFELDELDGYALTTAVVLDKPKYKKKLKEMNS